MEGHMVQDHVHMLVSIPPKHSVAAIVGYIKGKKRNFNGEKFWGRGYTISTVGLNEDQIRNYVRNQEQLHTLGMNEEGRF